MTVRLHWCTDRAEIGCADGDVRCHWCPLNMPVMRWSDLFGSASLSWVQDAYSWRGHAMLGKYAHWCQEWDDLPVDETTEEWASCTCYPIEVYKAHPPIVHEQPPLTTITDTGDLFK